MIAKQVRVTLEIDAAILSVLHAGKDDLAMFAAMGKHMEDFRWLVDNAGLNVMNDLCRRYGGLFRYAKLLETISDGIRSGAIKAPRQ